MMNTTELQQEIIKAIDVVVNNRLNNYSLTSSIVGVVASEPKGFECFVRSGNEDVTCIIPEHLHSWIQEGDIVVLQDLYNDGLKKMIVGKTGSIQKNASIVIADENNRLISGRDGVFEEEVRIAHSVWSEE